MLGLEWGDSVYNYAQWVSHYYLGESGVADILLKRDFPPFIYLHLVDSVFWVFCLDFLVSSACIIWVEILFCGD